MKELKVVYIHGYGSSIKDSDPKYDAIKSLNPSFADKVNLFSIAPDYDLGYSNLVSDLKEKIKGFNPDLIIGTSMGGYSANILGNELNIPFVSLNPVIDPNELEFINLKNKGYLKFIKNNNVNNLVFLNSGDEILDSSKTKEYLEGSNVTVLEGGCHRFMNIEDILDDIEILLEIENFCNSGDNGVN